MQVFRTVAFIAAGLALTLSAFAQDIRIVDDKVSIRADAVPLGRLLRLLDEATGMKSKVAPELANRKVSVRFADLSMAEAVHKLFEGQSLDYIMVDRQSISVTRPSQSTAANRGAAVPPTPAVDNTIIDSNPQFTPPQAQGNVNGVAPGNIQTPFGPMANPRANAQGAQQNSLVPMVAPGQPASFGNGIFGSSGNSSLPGFNSQPAVPANTPFGPPTMSPGGVAPTPTTTVPRNP